MNIQTQDARQRLLDAALTLFSEKGYAAASVSEIVTAAGVTKPMLYYYFKNKEGIYLELMNYAFTEFQGMIERYKHIESDSADKILCLFSDVMTLQLGKLEHAKLIYSMLYGPPQGAPFIDFEQYHATLACIVSDILKKGLDDNELNDMNIEKITMILLSVLFFCLDSNIVNCIDSLGVDDMKSLISEIIDKYRK